VSDSEAPLTQAVGEALESALSANRAIAMVKGSAVIGMKAFVDDLDVSQDAADAIALGVYNAGGPGTGFHASEIDSTGVITELTDPVVI
jgi:hypothetical protein